MDRVRRLIEAQAAYRLSLYGEGVGVAVVDSGINDRHPDLKGRVVYSYNYLTNSSDAADDCGHGTHISGIIGGTGEASGGRYQGLAPRCHFVSLKILDSRGNGDSVSLIRALYWLMEHGKEYDVRIINISVGGRSATGKNAHRAYPGSGGGLGRGFCDLCSRRESGAGPGEHYRAGNLRGGDYGGFLRR